MANAIDTWIAESIAHTRSIIALPLERALAEAPLAKAKAIDLGRVLIAKGRKRDATRVLKAAEQMATALRNRAEIEHASND